MLEKLKKKINISHTTFAFIYTLTLYLVCNSFNFDKISKWFIFQNKIDYTGVLAYLIVGWLLFLFSFLILLHKKTAKFVSIFFIIISCAGTYFIKKYDIAIERTMLMNVFYTDTREASGFLSFQMVPYLIFLGILPIALISRIQISYKPKYFLTSSKHIAISLVFAVLLLYIKFDSIHRAGNISKKHVVRIVTPINFIQSFGSLVQYYTDFSYFKSKKPVKIDGKIKEKSDLVVVLAIGETSRQKNFSLYGYKGNETNPRLSKDKNIHVLNGRAKIGSTMYALPQILKKNNIPLPTVTSQLGVNTACYVNYTLFDNCKAVGEIEVSNCKHGTCYDEDVIPLLEKNLQSYKSGQNLVVLHIGGGSHGPNYHLRHPKEFAQFKPMCMDADVVNKCTIEELYNSFDNTILYVDYVVSEIIKSLDKSKLPYVFIYLSDHGESLMENDRIFHGMPPGIQLPPEQSHIPLIVKSSLPINIIKREDYWQQDVYDTILDLFTIESNATDNSKSFIKISKK